jgi:AraC family transcriptional activator of tynA and feaB
MFDSRIAPMTRRQPEASSVSKVARHATPKRFDNFRGGREAETGAAFPLPDRSLVEHGFRLKARSAKIGDSEIMDLCNESLVHASDLEDRSNLILVRAGSWSFESQSYDRFTAVAGKFVLLRSARPGRIVIAPHSVATVLILPTSPFAGLIADRPITGTTDSAEMQLIKGHANTVLAMISELGPAGVQAARDVLVELTKAIVTLHVDTASPPLGPSLAEAAKGIADGRLADPRLSPDILARELNVSVRTLHRAFAATNESVATYIRRRRLEQARSALLDLHRWSISEIAAHWQFADSSHFIRTFAKRYGQSPAKYARASMKRNEGSET